MNTNFNEEQLRAARRANLFEYLMTWHRDLFKLEGNSLHPKDNHSLSIKRGYSGYLDFATNEKGNSVDFLTRYLNYSVPEAVNALAGDSKMTEHPVRRSETPIETFKDDEWRNTRLNFPKPFNGQYKRLYAYMINRGIPADVIQMLVDKKIMYQSEEKNNIVFINPERDFAEIRGTYTYGKPFHKVIKARADRFWWFKPVKSPAEVVYVCEAAIDAISLYVLQRREGGCSGGVYVSLAGVANQQTIDRIKGQYRTVLAVDNDDAGELRRRANPDLEYILPKHKDWNEDLQIG